jgi:hypothetical protein
MYKNLGKFFLNSAFNLDEIPWGGAMKNIAMNLKMTPKQMPGSCEAVSIFVIFLDCKSSVHFSIVTKFAMGLCIQCR